MIVTQENIVQSLADISKEKFISLDTETTGLRWWDQDRLFSIIIATQKDVYYFNFNHIIDAESKKIPNQYILKKEHFRLFESVFAMPDVTWFMHNAKFDMGMLSREGLRLAGVIHCTDAIARILNSSYHSYTLKECLKRLNLTRGIKGVEKSDLVLEYIKKHNLTKKISLVGKKKPVTLMYFDRVNFDIMVEYGEKDAQGTFELGKWQIRQIEELSRENPKIKNVVQIERETTKATFEMEKAGLKLDVAYTESCVQEELESQKSLKQEFENYTGKKYKDSGKMFAEVFDLEGVDYPTTDKGNPSFDKEALDQIDHPIANIIREIRGSEKRLGSYYSSFLYYLSSETGRVHGSIRQLGADTGRMSITSPAMQTIPKEQDGAAVRKCFVPEKDFCLFLPDYDQMEYRLMLDIAQEHGLIQEIINGLDVHTATGDLVGIARTPAKAINFGLLYGQGPMALSETLGISLEEARRLIYKYFTKLPKVQKYIKDTKKSCENNDGVYNQYGKFSKLPKNAAYKAPNYDIQGSCAYIVKIAMPRCQALLEGKKSRMLLQVHDELIFEIHKDELELCPQIVDIMEKAYEFKSLPLSAGPSYSWKSWGNKKEGYPGEEERDSISA